MAKTVIKEIIIMLLICLAIILVLGFLLYDYIPMAKVIPETVSYTIPESVKDELLAAGGVDESQVILTYEVDSTDLNNYKKVNSYKAGKANPFSSFETTGENTVGSSSSTNSGNNNNAATNSSNNNNTTSGGSYYQDKGTK